jgi:hypothetical protein
MPLWCGLMKIPPLVLWILLGVALAASFCLDFGNTTQGGAIDLRNRITGERLLAHGIDAYHYKWSRGEPEEYGDVYNNPQLKVSKTTATPTLLLLHEPLAPLPYRLGEFLWLLLQWLMLLGTAWLWLRQRATGRQRLWLAAFVVGFTYTSMWRLHAERGQAYVLLLLVFAGWLVATLDAKPRWSFVAGLLAGLLIALRPPFILLLPFLALHRRRQLAGVAVGLLIAAGLPLLLNLGSWSDYLTAMQDNSYLYRHAINPRPGAQHYPAMMEGTSTEILANFAVIPYADFSIFTFLRWIGLGPVPAWLPLLVIALPFGVWLWLTRQQPAEKLLPGLVAWFFVIDLFLPAYRNSYNDVLILNLAALVILRAAKFSWAGALILLALPLGWYLYVFAPEDIWLINLPTCAFALAAVLLLFPFDAGRRGHQAGA